MSVFTRRHPETRRNKFAVRITEANAIDACNTTHDDEFAEGQQENRRAERRDRRDRNRRYKRDPYAE